MQPLADLLAMVVAGLRRRRAPHAADAGHLLRNVHAGLAQERWRACELPGVMLIPAVYLIAIEFVSHREGLQQLRAPQWQGIV